MSTTDVGARNEAIAVDLLVARGYRIVERNFRVKRAELDIIAVDAAGVLCFIEVRSRADDGFGHAAESVGFVKRAKVTLGARAYLAQRQPVCDRVRFDVVAITGDRAELIADAWRLSRDL